MNKLLLLFGLGLCTSVVPSDYTTVYICTSSKDKCYHVRYSCDEMHSCHGELAAVTLNDAKNVYHRTLCEAEETE